VSEPQVSNRPLSLEIARSSLAVDLASVPPEVVDYAKLCIADALGIGFASHHYDFSSRAVAGVRAMAAPGPAVVIGLDDGLSPRDAALLNGTLVHGLDFDDTHLGSVVHCSASAVPTALALASETDVSGTSFLLAVLIATEIDARLGSAAGGTFQQLGFHPTGLVGIFGATVAAVRLLGGDVQDMVRAQGIALSMTGGSMAFLEAGTWTKRLHPGWAAQSALAAAKLAMAGFDAPQEAYSGRHGFYALYTRAAENADKVEWDDAFREFAIASVAIKPYPICHFNHAPVDAALTLTSTHGLNHHEIEEVTVALHERQLAVVAEPLHRKRRPGSEYDAKFSAPYAVAAALVGGRVGLRELEADSRTNPEILALADRISCAHDARSQYPKLFSGGVSIKMKDGRRFEQFETINRGAEGRLLNEAEVRAKFVDNCRLVLSEARTEFLWDTIMGLDTAPDCSALMAGLRGLDDAAVGNPLSENRSRIATC